MSSGGGGNSGTTRYEWSDQMAPRWDSLLNRASIIGNQGYTPYGTSEWLPQNEQGYNDPRNTGASRVQGFNDDQYTAFQRMRDLAGGQNNSAARAGSVVAEQLAGGALTNPYAGDNPFFRQNLQAGLQDITDAYQKGTAADTTAMFNKAGVFGGDAHQRAVADNENALARNLSRTANDAYQQQYDRSANLSENVLNRQLSAVPLAYQSQGLQTDLIDRLYGMGAQQQQQGQRQMDDSYNRWTERMNWDRGNTNWLADLFGRAQGGTSMVTQQAGYQPMNWGSAALGAGLLGAGLFGGR